MTRYWIISFITALTFLSCAGLPTIQPLENGDGLEACSRCDRIYAAGQWQLVHALKAKLPDGSQYTMMGVSQIDSSDRSLHCVLLTLEGTVMFEARYQGEIEVLRALPPFDKGAFARGMLDDIMLVLMAPIDDMPNVGYRSGRDGENVLICRRQAADGSVQDNVFKSASEWEIRRYDADHDLVRRVRPGSGHSDFSGSAPIPPVIELKAFGMLGYELELTLVDAQPLDSATLIQKGTP